MYYVYILQSKKDQGLYVGYTGDLVARVQAHDDGGSQSTSCRRPLCLIYYEAYLIEADALGRERFLKSGAGRRFIDKQLHNYFLEFPRS